MEDFGLAAAEIDFGSARLLDQRHDVDAAGFQHRAFAERDLVQLQFVDALGHRVARTGQEAGADAKGRVAQAQVERGRLDLVLDEVVGRQNQPRLRHRGDGAVGKDALSVEGKCHAKPAKSGAFLI